MKKIINALVVLLPWFLRRWVLVHCYGYNIAKTAKIGFSYIFPKYLEMQDGAKIANLNVAVNLDRIQMDCNSSISRGNWITGFPTGTESRHFANDIDRRSELIIGQESAITKNHHIDCTNSIVIGHHTIIAGYRSQFLTHSINVYENRQESKPIVIGDFCFISTSVIFLGGAVLPSCCVIAAGSVYKEREGKEYTLFGGVPARVIKGIPCNSKYFTRMKGFVV